LIFEKCLIIVHPHVCSRIAQIADRVSRHVKKFILYSRQVDLKISILN